MTPPLPYDLRIGVTGHRTITNEVAVASAVAALLSRIGATLTPVPLAWTVISPLARGADRVVARAVLDQPDAHLEVVTPFPLAEYRKDFESAEDHGEFEQLLARAGQVHELDGHPHAAVSHADR